MAWIDGLKRWLKIELTLVDSQVMIDKLDQK